MLISFILSLIANFNYFQQLLFHYNTTLSFNAYLWRDGINTIMAALFITVAILIPGLAGELLHYETSPKQRTGSFLHYIQTTFLSCNVAKLIALGYFVCFIMLGIQSFLIKVGQTYFGVWVEHSWVTSSSNAYLPFLAAFTFGYKTSFSEEIMYRLYAINLGKKVFGKIFPNTRGMNIVLVCLLSSLIWGFTHSNYPIFPMWFRGLEVTCIGIFLAFILLYRKFKEILRQAQDGERSRTIPILKAYLHTNKNMYINKSQEQIKKEITPHGWDPAVVDVASEDFLKDLK